MVRVFSSTRREAAPVPLPPPLLGGPRGWGLRTPRSPRPAWAAGSGRPRLRTPVTGYCGGSASSSRVPSGPLTSRVGIPELPPLGLQPVQAPGEPEGGRTVSGLGSARARLGSAAGRGSSPASAPHSEPLPLPPPAGPPPLPPRAG